jgi:hypothetical protein
METAGIRENDLIECDVKGRRFFAFVDRKGVPRRESRSGAVRSTGIAITPITPGITYRNVRAADVIGHYRRSKNSAPRKREEVTA